MELIVRLDGGLGNQLFQYAAGYTLARKVSARLRLDLTPLLYTRHLARDYLLDRFQIDVEPEPTSRLGLMVTKLSGSRQPALKWPALVARRLLGITDISEPAPYCFAPPVIPQVRRVRITGWWQAFGYLSEFEGDVRRQFQLKTPSAEFRAWLKEITAAESSVSLHVRRGDYLTDRPDAVLPASYYRSAIRRLSADPARTRVFVFSDDLDWAMSNLDLPMQMTPIDLRGGASPEEELYLMAACRDHVIANSTFSWWGAWLDPRREKRVVAPYEWIGREDSYFPDLIPPEWLLLRVGEADVSRASAAAK